MWIRSLIPGCLFVAWTATQTLAQQNITVQLPTFNVTTVQTTVSVPDRGTALLGGINRFSEGSVSRGVPMLNKVPVVSRLFGNRGIGRDVGASQMTITPRIIIQEEEELRQTGVSAELLSQLGTSPSPHVPRPIAGADNAPADPVLAQKADFIARNIARHPAAESGERTPPGNPSVEQVRQQNEAARAQRTAEAEEYFAKGQRAEAEGKGGVAKVWYQMAARRASGELQRQVAARLAILAGSAASDKLAGR